MLSWFQYDLKSFWHQGLGVVTNNGYHMRNTSSESNQGTQLAQISLNTTPLPRIWRTVAEVSELLPSHNKFILSISRVSKRGRNPQSCVFPGRKEWEKWVKRNEKPRNSLNGRKWVACAIAHFVWDGQLCTCSWNQPCGWDTAAPGHIHCPADSLWLQSLLKEAGIAILPETTCVAHTLQASAPGICAGASTCAGGIICMWAEMYKISHPVSNGLPDVQKSLTIVQNLWTPPRQDCQVEKVDISKKTQIVAQEKKKKKNHLAAKQRRRKWEIWRWQGNGRNEK